MTRLLAITGTYREDGMVDQAVAKAVETARRAGAQVEVVNLRDLAAMLTRLQAGARWELVPFPPERKAIDIGDYYSDYGLIRRELAWSPKVQLLEGLRRTCDYYRQHGTHYWEAAT